MNTTSADKRFRPFASWLREIGLCRATGWRWRQLRWVETTNIGGRLCISQHAIDRFCARAGRGDFAKDQSVPGGKRQ